MDGNAPFHKAADFGAKKTFDLLISSYFTKKKPNNEKKLELMFLNNSDERNIFDLAVQNGNLEIADEILEIVRLCGGESATYSIVNRQDSHGTTILKRLCSNIAKDKTKEIRYMFDLGADSSIIDDLGYDALSEIIARNPNSPNAEAVIEQFETFLGNRDLNPDFRDKFGRNYFFLACSSGNFHIVKHIYKLIKPDVNERNLQQETPLMAACCKDHMEIVDFLLEHDADIFAADENGETAFTYACNFGNFSIMERLEKAGADIHTRNNEGNTALFDPVCNYYDVALLLIKKGIDCTILNNVGKSAAFVLLEHMCEPDWSDWHDKTDEKQCVNVCSAIIQSVGLENLDAYLEYDERLKEKLLSDSNWNEIWSNAKKKAIHHISTTRTKEYVEKFGNNGSFESVNENHVFER